MKNFEFETSSGDIVIICVPAEMKDKIIVFEKPKDKPVKVIHSLTKKEKEYFDNLKFERGK